MPMNRNVQFLGSQKRVVSVSKKEFVADNAQINQIFDQIQDQNILFFDPTYKICQSDQCVSVLDGVNFYSDKYHITPQGTMQFKTEIEELFNTRLHNNKPSLFVN
jgi:hypothetical protein